MREQCIHNLLILLGKDMFVKLKRKTPLKLCPAVFCGFKMKIVHFYRPNLSYTCLKNWEFVVSMF